MCDQEDIEGFMLRVLQFLWNCVRQKHVSRAYGGVRCAKCVCDTIKQAFFTEKQQAVVKVLEAQAQSQKAKQIRSFFKWSKKNPHFYLSIIWSFSEESSES